jgi:phosphopantetheinyl transferase (holo-ACP synthase)
VVGNDIVDIAQAKKDSNWQRPRFLDKLFTLKEQQTIHASDNPCIMVWQLWSMKEAAYKLYTQINPSRFYNPKGFACEINNKKGFIRFKNFNCYVETKITSDYIISEARLEIKSMTSEVTILESSEPKLQSKAIREEALKVAIKCLNISDENAIIANSDFNIPTLEIDSEVTPISLTHHGNYGAFAIA